MMWQHVVTLRRIRILRPRAGNRYLGVAILLVASIVATLGGLEMALRTIPGLLPARAMAHVQAFRDSPAFLSRPDPYLGYLPPPNFHGTMRGTDVTFTVTTDSRGFRNAGPWPEHADIVVLGDSLTFGFGVPDGESWVDLAARKLGGAVVVNLAVSGFGPLQQLRVYERFGAALRPRMVLVGFFPGNDFKDTAKFAEWLALGSPGHYMRWRYSGLARLGDATLHSVIGTTYLYSLVRTAIGLGVEHDDGDTLIHETRDGRLVLLPNQLGQLQRRAMPGRPEFDQTIGALKDLDRRVRADDGRLLVVVLPSKEYVYLPLMRAGAPDPLHYVFQAFDESNLAYLDLTPRFRDRASAGDRLFFEIDSHPNRKGYGLIADVVVEYLRSGAAGDLGQLAAAERQ